MKVWFDIIPWPVCPDCDESIKPYFLQGFWRFSDHKDLADGSVCAQSRMRIIAN